MGDKLTQNLPGVRLGRYCRMSEHTQQDLGTTDSEMRPETSAANPAKTSGAVSTAAVAAEHHGSIGIAVEAGQSGSLCSAQTAGNRDSSTLTDDQWREALAAYHDGATAPAIARRFGITAQARRNRDRLRRS